MASIYQRRGGWRAQIDRKGIRESKTFATKQEALDWAAFREAEILSGRGIRSRQTLVQAIERWRMHRDVTRSDETRLRAFSAFAWASAPLADLTRDTLSAWRDARLSVVSPGTVAREMATLRSILAYARDDLGWLSASPLDKVKTPKEPPARRRLITDDEIAGMLAELGYADRVETVQHEVAVALLLALETGMRAGELTGLLWRNVNGNVARLPKTKNGDARAVPLSKRAVALLEQMRVRKLSHVRKALDPARVFHIDADSLDSLFRRAREAAGLDGFTFHDSRATAITRLAQILSPLELARMVGHRDLNSLLSYFASPADELASKLG